MIRFEQVRTVGWEEAVRGMRNSFNSWDKSDSRGSSDAVALGSEDLKVMAYLARAGSSHAKYRRFIGVYVDIVAPLYWWKQFDTYKIGTVVNSTSTMHTIAEKPFSITDFSYHQMPKASDCLLPVTDFAGSNTLFSPRGFLMLTIKYLNECREQYLATKDKKYWWCMIQLLPESYNQRRTVLLNYEVLAKIYKERKNHKLDEWGMMCTWIETLPYAKEIIIAE